MLTEKGKKMQIYTMITVSMELEPTLKTRENKPANIGFM